MRAGSLDSTKLLRILNITAWRTSHNLVKKGEQFTSYKTNSAKWLKVRVTLLHSSTTFELDAGMTSSVLQCSLMQSRQLKSQMSWKKVSWKVRNGVQGRKKRKLEMKEITQDKRNAIFESDWMNLSIFCNMKVVFLYDLYRTLPQWGRLVSWLEIINAL